MIDSGMVLAYDIATTSLYKGIQDLLIGSNNDSAAMATGVVFAYIDEDKGNNVQIHLHYKEIFPIIAHYYENNPNSRDMDQRTFVITALKGTYPAKNNNLKGKPMGIGYIPITQAWAASTLPMQVRVKNAATTSMYDNMLFGYYVGIRNAENFIVPDEDNNVKNIVYNVMLNYIKTHPESFSKDKDTFLPAEQIAPAVVIKALEARYKRGN